MDKMVRIQALLKTLEDASLDQKVSSAINDTLASRLERLPEETWEDAARRMIEAVKKADDLLLYATQKAPGLRREFEREVEAETAGSKRDFSPFEAPREQQKPRPQPKAAVPKKDSSSDGSDKAP